MQKYASLGANEGHIVRKDVQMLITFTMDYLQQTGPSGSGIGIGDKRIEEMSRFIESRYAIRFFLSDSLLDSCW